MNGLVTFVLPENSGQQQKTGYVANCRQILYDLTSPDLKVVQDTEYNINCFSYNYLLTTPG